MEGREMITVTVTRQVAVMGGWKVKKKIFQTAGPTPANLVEIKVLRKPYHRRNVDENSENPFFCMLFYELTIKIKSPSFEDTLQFFSGNENFPKKNPV